MQQSQPLVASSAGAVSTDTPSPSFHGDHHGALTLLNNIATNITSQGEGKANPSIIIINIVDIPSWN